MTRLHLKREDWVHVLADMDGETMRLETIRRRIDGGELSPLPETTENLGLKLGDFE